MTIYQKKVCLLGDFAVGKTSLIRRFVERRFDDSYLTTVGVAVSRKQITYPDSSLNLLIWDLAGGRDHRQTGYLTGVSGSLIVCDLTRRVTLASYREYTEQLYTINPKAQVVLLANKSDLIDNRSITDEELKTIAGELKAPWLLTSAKNGDDVDRAFSLLADMLMGDAG